MIDLTTMPLTDVASELAKKIEDHTAVVGVFGLGYVGLPFAVEKAKVGFSVIGFDRSEPRVGQVNDGDSYILDVPTDELKPLVQKGLIRATTDFTELDKVDVVVVAVPTPLTKNLTPDLQYVEAVTREVAKHLRPGQMVSLESTTYPGTTDEVMKPILEATGLKADVDFFLAHSLSALIPATSATPPRTLPKLWVALALHHSNWRLSFMDKPLTTLSR
ncbi:MAG: NAD(P)-binding domain-containing protein [Fimbriimonadaceae bacterium]